MNRGKVAGQLFALITLIAPAHADQLWNNGNHDEYQVLGNYYRILDDFYVPGGGWWIDKAEVDGMFFTSSGIESVNIRIIEADTLTGEPDTSQAQWLPVIDFDVTESLEPWGFRLEADFHNTFLEGQRFYWIEFEVIGENGEYIRGLRSDNARHNPAYGNHALGNDYNLVATDRDLAFRLYGQPVKTIGYAAADDFKLKTLDDQWHALTFNLTGNHEWFDPGLYQIQLNKKEPALYRFDERGKHLVDFKVEDPDHHQIQLNKKKPALYRSDERGKHLADFRVEDPGATRFSTPLGDEMCREAPEILQSYCQDFVACAAYTFCGQIPIP
jgi:hypothetical protein